MPERPRPDDGEIAQVTIVAEAAVQGVSDPHDPVRYFRVGAVTDRVGMWS